MAEAVAAAAVLPPDAAVEAGATIRWGQISICRWGLAESDR
jgi:hypothetical protein